MRIYVASSWRNERQPAVVQRLRDAGHEVYDFRNPGPGEHGFAWSEIDPNWKSWTPEQFVEALKHPVSEHGFSLDMEALQGADATVLVLPCGRSAHLELGFAVGRDQLTIVLVEGATEPELMYRMCDHVCLSLDAVVETLAQAERGFQVTG